MERARSEFDHSGELASTLMFLQLQRDGVLRKIDGLTDAEARRPGVASGTSLAWLVRHLTAGERHWLCDEPVDDWAEASTPLPGMTVVQLGTAYRAVCARSDATLAACADLGDLGPPVEGRQPYSPRWRLQHMLEETARHAGHADILREQIDGTTGR